jgi:hypothetical protein
MRIDSAGNLLVGKTATAFSEAGVVLRGDSAEGLIQATRANNECIEVNRTGTDGAIAIFAKNGDPVGSIGNDGLTLTIGTVDTGFRFVDSVDSVSPFSVSQGAATDGQMNLGRNITRFKDLYLSGATKLFSNTNSPAANSTLGDVDFGARTDGTVTARVRGIAGSNGNGTDGQLTFYTASNTASQVAQERMRIDSAGNLLVGTDVSGGKVTIDSPSNDGLNVAVGVNNLVMISKRGNDGDHIRFQNSAGAIAGNINVTGTTTTYATSSDQRLKENIADADDAGSKIDAIQVRQYDWKADGSHQDYGMVAQELQLVAPEAVSGDADSEEMMGVDYSKLVPMLIKEIQSLRNRVAQLETGE